MLDFGGWRRNYDCRMHKQFLLFVLWLEIGQQIVASLVKFLALFFFLMPMTG